MADEGLDIRPAERHDVDTILRFIRELARYEKLEHEVDTSAERLHEHLFGERPVCEARIGEVDGVARGFALFFTSYTTFTTRPCMWLEDLFVEPEARGRGLGRALLADLAALCVERGMPRLDWYVLDWNEPAIGFYRRLGARTLDDWRVCRLQGEALAAMGRAGGRG